MDQPSLSIWRCFDSLRDPRSSPRPKRHPLINIIAMALCASLGGADDWDKVLEFVHQHQNWFQTFLSMPHGIPSRSTFERVLAALSPHGLNSCLMRWLHHCSHLLEVGNIAIDGKTLRGSGSQQQGLAMLHLVSAWATQSLLSLGQVAVEDKSNEIVAIPYLLRMLNLKGALVTLDAMGCQKEIARQIVEQEGDYLWTVKDNQPRLAETIRQTVARATEDPTIESDSFQSEERGHGRLEKRTCLVVYNLKEIECREEWKQLTVVGAYYCERTVGEKKSEEFHLFIGSRRASARVYAQTLRDHWSIENNLHWQLDVSFREDSCSVRDRNIAANLALLRKWALCLLKHHPSKGSISTKRYRAAMNTEYLQDVLFGGQNK